MKAWIGYFCDRLLEKAEESRSLPILAASAAADDSG
jgi:hypothetical protein